MTDAKELREEAEKELAKLKDEDLKEKIKEQIEEMAEEEKQRLEVSKKIKKEAEELLQNPNMLYNFSKDIEKYHVGQEKERLLTFLLALSCKSKKDYAFLLITGDSSAGKTRIMTDVLRYIPKDWWKRVGRLSRTALDYLSDQEFDLLWIQERRGGKEASETIRLSSVEDEGTEVWVTGRNETTGKFETQIYKVPGRGIVTTTVHTDLDAQDLTRSWLVNVDESEDQTKRIHEYETKEAAEPFEFKVATGKLEEDKTAVIKEALRQLEWDYIVIIPFAEELREFVSTKVLRSRRDLKKLQRLIRVITLLHQRIRPKFEINGTRFLLSTPEDLYITTIIAGETFQRTTRGLDRREQAVMEVLKNGSSLTRRQVATKCNKSMGWAYERLHSLMNKGYVDEDDSGKTHLWSLREDGDSNQSSSFIERLDFSILEKKTLERLEQLKNNDCLIFRGWINYNFQYWNPITGEIYPSEKNSTIIESEQSPTPDESKEERLTFADTSRTIKTPSFNSQRERMSEFLKDLIGIVRHNEGIILKETFKTIVKERGIPKQFLELIVSKFIEPVGDGLHLKIKPSIMGFKIDDYEGGENE